MPVFARRKAVVEDAGQILRRNPDPVINHGYPDPPLTVGHAHGQPFVRALGILAGELGRQRIIWIGFDILESNWPLRVSFPIFIANAVDWLNPANAKSSQLLVKAGDPFRLPLLEATSAAQVTLPDGTTKDLKLDPSANEFVFGDTYKAGVYKLHLGTNDTTFCANLLDAGESNIKPRDALQLGKYTKVVATTTKRANMEVWRTIATLGLLVLLVEWWYYHRRTV